MGENNKDYLCCVYSSPKVSRDILVSCFHQLCYKDLELLIAEIDRQRKRYKTHVSIPLMTRDDIG